MKVAITENTYAEQRLILGSDIPGVEHPYRPGRWHMHFKKRNRKYYEFYGAAFSQVDGYHVFNTVMFTNKPWCANFETMMPRGRQTLDAHHHASFDLRPDRYTRFMLKAMAADNCKRLMALSECNLRLQYMLYDIYPDLAERLKHKTCVVPVPQPLLVAEPHRQTNDRLKFFFVGRDFVRKGLPEAIAALARLRKKRSDFELVAITQTGNRRNYAFKDFQDSDEYLNSIENTISNSKDWLTIYPELPFGEVRRLMEECDVGLLPTWAESYGYSTLEMEAAALPCVTTNIRALPETNPCGWRVELPLNYAGEVALTDAAHKQRVRQMLTDGLYNIFDSILDNRRDVISSSEAAWNFIRTEHSPHKYALLLSEIYSEF